MGACRCESTGESRARRGVPSRGGPSTARGREQWAPLVKRCRDRSVFFRLKVFPTPRVSRRLNDSRVNSKRCYNGASGPRVPPAPHGVFCGNGSTRRRSPPGGAMSRGRRGPAVGTLPPWRERGRRHKPRRPRTAAYLRPPAWPK